MKKHILLICLVGLSVPGIIILSSARHDGNTGNLTLNITAMDSNNVLTQQEQSEGWILMFNGKNTDGWRGYNKDSFPQTGWAIEDESLKCLSAESRSEGEAPGGDIIYNRKFRNFHFKIDWKISEGGNSGIFYLGQESPDFMFIYFTAPEMQVLDNERHPDANMGKDGNRKAGSLYDLIPAVPQNTKPAGEWNSVEIIVNKGHVIHMQNGEKVVEYQLWTNEWNELVAGSKFPALNPNWADVASEGYIGLQDHGNDVWFRNIKIRPL